GGRGVHGVVAVPERVGVDRRRVQGWGRSAADLRHAELRRRPASASAHPGLRHGVRDAGDLLLDRRRTLAHELLSLTRSRSRRAPDGAPGRGGPDCKTTVARSIARRSCDGSGGPMSPWILSFWPKACKSVHGPCPAAAP